MAEWGIERILSEEELVGGLLNIAAGLAAGKFVEVAIIPTSVLVRDVRFDHRSHVVYAKRGEGWESSTTVFVSIARPGSVQYLDKTHFPVKEPYLVNGQSLHEYLPRNGWPRRDVLYGGERVPDFETGRVPPSYEEQLVANLLQYAQATQRDDGVGLIVIPARIAIPNPAYEFAPGTHLFYRKRELEKGECEKGIGVPIIAFHAGRDEEAFLP